MPSRPAEQSETEAVSGTRLPRSTSQTSPAEPGTRRRHLGWAAVLVSVLSIGVIMMVQPFRSPPLYDGLGFPDEPYRWVQPPPGAPKTPAVTTATAKVTIEADGTVPVIKGLSAEQGSQVAFQINTGDLRVPQGATAVTATATPVAPPAAPPADGTLASNLYEFTAAAQPSGVPVLFPGKTLIVNMRADKTSNQAVVLEQYSKGTWSQIPTSRVGTDIYAAELPAFGQYALVRLPNGVHPSVTPAGRADAQGGFSTGEPTQDQLRQVPQMNYTPFYIGGVLVALLLVGMLYLARRRMAR